MGKYYALLLAVWVLGPLPVRVIYAVARLAADAVYLLRPGIRRAVRSNMRHVLGPAASSRQVERATREAIRNAARYYADLIRMPRLNVRRFYERDLTLDGLPYLQQAIRGGKGAVLASAHLGNPEIAVQALASVDILVLALTEPLEPRRLFDLTQRLRSGHGHTYRAADFGGVKEALRRLHAGGTVAILIDRDIQGRGVPLPFCGAEARMPMGAVDLALRSGAELIPAWVHREPGFHYHAYMGPPLPLVRSGDRQHDLRTNSARLLALLEEHLRADPGQWAVLERIWPDPEPEVAGAADSQRPERVQ